MLIASVKALTYHDQIGWGSVHPQGNPETHREGGRMGQSLLTQALLPGKPCLYLRYRQSCATYQYRVVALQLT